MSGCLRLNSTNNKFAKKGDTSLLVQPVKQYYGKERVAVQRRPDTFKVEYVCMITIEEMT